MKKHITGFMSLLFIGLVAGATFAGCSKEKDDEPVTPTPKPEDPILVIEGDGPADVKAAGGTFEIKVKDNIDSKYTVKITDQKTGKEIKWITQTTAATRATVTKTLTFKVEKNDTQEERVGVITITGSDNKDLKQTVTVTQKALVAGKIVVTFNSKSVTAPTVVPVTGGKATTIDWGDGSAIQDYVSEPLPTHDYSAAGNHQVTITTEEGAESIKFESIENVVELNVKDMEVSVEK